MFPVRIPEGRAPRVLALIDGITFPLLLDTGGEVSVLPLSLFRRFNQSAEQLASSLLFLLLVMELCNCVDLLH